MIAMIQTMKMYRNKTGMPANSKALLAMDTKG
jgi:hypothetical protein